MLDYELTGPFRKDSELMQKRRKKMQKLNEVMHMLINEQPLLPKHKNHPLYGKFIGKWECHVEPDWLLIYRTDKDQNRIVFHRTGSHSDLY